ncbi:MAG: NAD-dependent deacylase [Flavobacteriia bacterium]|nr:NAD-dependent deacylase [Flavobacteriia bacterium]
MKKIAVLTGAGISAESGISTFRDSDGLWENLDIQKVASPEGWLEDPELVLDFYNQRRRKLSEVQPNSAHIYLKELEKDYEVTVITQNVDDLHERAGSSNVIHLHGELLKSRSENDDSLIYDCPGDINLGDRAEDGAQLRPHIVWFGEMVPMLDKAVEVVEDCDIMLVIGTSLMVYPAASLIHYQSFDKPIYLIDPDRMIVVPKFPNLTVIQKTATEGVKDLPL